jgi:hypothetical protein
MACTFYFDIDLDISWRKTLCAVLKLTCLKARRNITPGALALRVALQYPNQYRNENDLPYLVSPIDYYGMDLPF